MVQAGLDLIGQQSSWGESPAPLMPHLCQGLHHPCRPERPGTSPGSTERLVLVLAAQSCPTLFDPMDHSLPGSSVRGILQARILEWFAMPFSGGSS